MLQKSLKRTSLKFLNREMKGKNWKVDTEQKKKVKTYQPIKFIIDPSISLNQ